MENENLKGQQRTYTVFDEANNIDPKQFAKMQDVYGHMKMLKVTANVTTEEIKKFMTMGSEYVIATSDTNVVKTTGKYMGVHRISGEIMMLVEHRLETDVYEIIIGSHTRIKCSYEHPTESYMIQDTRQYVGNLISWWAAEGRGYTCDFNLAGRFSKKKAVDIMNSHKDRVYIWPTSYIEKHTTTTVDMQNVTKTDTRDEYGWLECAHTVMLEIADAEGMVAKLPDYSNFPKELVDKIAVSVKTFIISNDTLYDPHDFYELRKALRNFPEADVKYTAKIGWQDFASAITEWKTKMTEYEQSRS